VATRVCASLAISGSTIGGKPVPTLLALAERAAAIVVGRRSAGRLSRVLNGSTAAEIAEYASCPVVVVHEHPDLTDSETGPIVVGVEGSAASEAAIAFAFEQATTRQTCVTAVHAYQLPVHPMLGGGRQATLTWAAATTKPNSY
jgi:hypothetical protein